MNENIVLQTKLIQITVFNVLQLLLASFSIVKHTGILILSEAVHIKYLMAVHIKYLMIIYMYVKPPTGSDRHSILKPTSATHQVTVYITKTELCMLP